MRKIAIIICICLLTISVGLLDVHNGNLDGFLIMLVGITCFVSAVAPPITFYLHVILPYKKIAESIHKADENSTANSTEPTNSTELYNIKPIKDFPDLYYDSDSHIVFKRVHKDSSLSGATKYKYFPLMSKDNKFYYYDPNSNEIKLEKKDIDNDN